MNATLSKAIQTPSKQAASVIKGRDIVIIGLQPWYYEIGSNCKNIAAHFAKNNRVLYVNLPLNRKTFFSKQKNSGVQKHHDIIKSGQPGIKEINEKMWEFYPSSIVESINWMPSTASFKTINHINNKRFANDIKAAIEELNFKEIILFNDNDIFNGYHLKKLLKPDVYIYYMRDFLQGYDYWKKHCTILEPELIKKADIVVTNSTYYAEYASHYNRNSHYIGQGCDLNLFDANKKYPMPVEMQYIMSPVIGYTGFLDSARLDENILKLIAKAHPDWSIVLIGPQDELFAESDLHKMGNVQFLGRKNLEELPSYIKYFDVCINPQFQNEITKGNYPLKIDEYLAMAKPVAATRTKAMKLFEEHTYLANNPGEYVGLIEKALAENNKSKEAERTQFAGEHSWENSMTSLYKVIEKYFSDRRNS